MPNYDRWIAAGLLFTLGIVLIFGAYLLDETNQREATASRIEEERIERGTELFATNCATCHGKDGEGLGGVFPALNAKEFLENANDDLIHETILLGRPNTAMPAWGLEQGGPFTDEDALDLVAFIRNWEATAPSLADAEPVAIVGDPVEGASLFSLFCYFCHGIDGEGSSIAPALNDPAKLAQFDDTWYTDTIKQGRESLGMPTWGTVLSEQQIADIVSFIRAWESGPTTVASIPTIAGDAVRGSALFESTCAVCHGSNGVGSVTAPTLNDPQLIASRGIDFYRTVITEGRLDKGMPRWGQVLSPLAMTDLLALIDYWGGPGVVAAPQTDASSTGAAPAESTGTAASDVDPEVLARGEAVFLREAGGVGCAYCHGPEALGDIGPNIRGKSYEAILQAFGTVQQMEIVIGLKDEDIRAVAAYLGTLGDGTSASPASGSQPSAPPQPDAPAPSPTQSDSSAAPSSQTDSTTAETPVPAGDAGAAADVDPAIIARGEAVFLREAGGVGCAYCHGPEARGDIGPNIRGKSYEAILQAFGTVQQMEIVIGLKDEDIRAVAAYLATLE